ncbi:MAG: C-terminal binding protein [Candidatus Accumulibacter sp.]|nr:C-terminal binding protein [Accumulibacter sp.]
MDSKQKTVIVVDCDHENIDPERAVLKDSFGEPRWLKCRTEDEVIAQCGEGDGLIIQYAPMTRRVLEKLPRCKAIVRLGVGVDTVDLRAAADLGIVVCNVPDYGTNEVSDHALALMLCLTRKLVRANALTKAGRWDCSLMKPIFRHQVQTVGIVGLGRIGRAMAHKTQALGMTVLGCDPYVSPGDLPDYVSLTGLDDLLRRADVVSIHCPLTEETRHLIDEKRLALMKPTAYLVNTARGNIVDEAALDRHLAAGKLAGAAMDVLAKEPGAADHPLFRHENFIATPHMAWYSEESARELKRKAAEEVRSVLLGEAPRYQVNKFQ